MRLCCDVRIFGPSTDPNAHDFFAGAMQIIEPLITGGDITVVFESEVSAWRPDVAERLMEQALKKTKDIAAVLAPNYDTAGGALRALVRHGIAGKTVVTGQDATAQGLQRLLDGTQGMTIFKNTQNLVPCNT